MPDMIDVLQRQVTVLTADNTVLRQTVRKYEKHCGELYNLLIEKQADIIRLQRRRESCWQSVIGFIRECF